MGYVEENLLPDDLVIYRGRLHRKIFVAPVVGLVLGGAMIAAPVARITLSSRP